MIQLLLAVALAAPARAQLAQEAPEISTADVEAIISTAQARVPLPLDVVVRIAVDRNLQFLASAKSAENLIELAKAQDALFDPVYNASYSQSKQELDTVPPPGYVQTLTTAKSQTIQTSITKNTDIGTSLALTAQNVRTENTVIPPIQPLFASGVQLSLTQPLLQGGGKAAAYAAAKIALLGGEAALATAQRTLETTIASVEAAYWTLRQSEKDQQAANGALAIAQETLRRNQALNRLNLMSSHDVLTSQEQAEILKVTAIEAARARSDAADALVFLVYGETVRSELAAENLTVTTSSAAETAAATSVLPLDQAVKLALSQRTDVLAAQRTLEQADASLAVAKNGLLPLLNVNGSVGTGGSNQSGQQGAAWDSVHGTFLNRDHQWSLGGDLSIPIGNRPARDRYAAAQAADEQARLAYVGAQNAAISDVRSAVRAVQMETVRYAVARTAAAVAWRQFSEERERLRLGLVDAFRVLEAQNLALQAVQTLDSVENSLDTARTDYRLAVGTIAQGYMSNLRDIK